MSGAYIPLPWEIRGPSWDSETVLPDDARVHRAEDEIKKAGVR